MAIPINFVMVLESESNITAPNLEQNYKLCQGDPLSNFQNVPSCVHSFGLRDQNILFFWLQKINR